MQRAGRGYGLRSAPTVRVVQRDHVEMAVFGVERPRGGKRLGVRNQVLMRQHDTARPGRPLPGLSLRIVGADGSDMPRDDASTGEIRLQGDSVSPRYWNAPEASDEARDERGYFKTGDLAAIDSEGSVRIVDRAKDLIRSGALSISSVEIENVLASHPSVSEVAVAGVPDETWCETPVAWIVLKAGAPQDPAGLEAHARDHLASFKVPRRFRFLTELPKSGTGKVLKRALRMEFA